MFQGWNPWRKRPEPREARDAMRAATEQRAKLQPINEFLTMQRDDNHFSDRLAAAFIEAKGG